MAIFLPSSNLHSFGRGQQWSPLVPLPSDTTSLLAAWEWCRGKKISNYLSSTLTTTNSTLEFINGTAAANSTYALYSTGGASYVESGTYGGYVKTTHVTQQNIASVSYENLKEYDPTFATNPTSVPKTFSMAFSFDATPSAAEVHYLLGTSLGPGQSGWRVYLYNGNITFQYFYNNASNTATTATLQTAFAPTVGTKYLLTVLVQTQGAISFYLNGNTTPMGSTTINVRSWISGFEPGDFHAAGYASGATNYGFNGRTYGLWVWNKHITTIQLTQLYTNLQGYGVVN